MAALGGGAGFGGSLRANLPASGNGGGALNLGRAGDGSGSSTSGASVFAARLGAGGGGALAPDGGDGVSVRPPGGGGGGGGREPLESPPLEGVVEAGGGGGGGGEAAAAFCAFCCSSRRKSTMNSWFSLMKSSVNPLLWRSWPKCSRHMGSNASRRANSDRPRPPFRLVTDDVAELGGDGAEECREPNRPPSKPCFSL